MSHSHTHMLLRRTHTHHYTVSLMCDNDKTHDFHVFSFSMTLLFSPFRIVILPEEHRQTKREKTRKIIEKCAFVMCSQRTSRGMSTSAAHRIGHGIIYSKKKLKNLSFQIRQFLFFEFDNDVVPSLCVTVRGVWSVEREPSNVREVLSPSLSISLYISIAIYLRSFSGNG